MPELHPCLAVVALFVPAVRCQTAWSRLPGLQRRGDCAVATDTVRQRVVMFGGQVTYDTPRGDTWEWDGTSWIQRVTVVSPRPRQDHAMAFDPIRQRVVLFGGNVTGSPYTVTDDTWEWDGTGWTERQPAVRPPPRFGHKLAYDRSGQRVLLFGGYGGTGNPQMLGDTWGWNGESWTQLSSGPPARVRHALAVEPWSGNIVLFGGTDGMTALPDTWRWSGSRWMRLTPVPSPPARLWHALAADEIDGHVLLTGGVGAGGLGRTPDAWSWDGIQWSPAPTLDLARAAHASAWDPVALAVLVFAGDGLSETRHARSGRWRVTSPNLGPPAQAYAPCAFDEARGRMVMLGGYTPGGYLVNTWELDDREWVERHPSRGPQSWAGWMHYNERRQRCQLVSGAAGGVAVWEWDGTDWTELPVLSPLPAAAGPVVFDSERQRSIMLGADSETLEWDGERWHRLDATHRPPVRSGRPMAYDRARRRIVLFGGSARIGGADDTWEWDGSDWIERFPAHRPRGRYEHSLVYDAARERVVLFGGSEWTDDVWEWDGVDWRQRTPANSPPGRTGHAAVYDSWRRRMVVFSGTSRTDDTWEYRPLHAAEFASSGDGCSGTRGTPTLSAVNQRLPWADAPFAIAVHGLLPDAATVVWLGFSDTTFAGLRLPLALAHLGMLDCHLRVAPEIGLAAVAVDGVARVTLPPVPDPSAPGTRFWLQSVAVDPLANPAGLVWSSAAAGRLGAR